MHLFSEVGSVQDVHLQPQRDGSYTYGLVLVCVLVINNIINFPQLQVLSIF